VNAQQVTDAVIDRLKERLRVAAEPVVEGLAKNVANLINKPVGRVGGKVIRSNPGEPPRRETGKYAKSWRSRVTVNGDNIRGLAYSPVKYGAYLQTGTARMAARPHVDEVVRRARPVISGQIANNL